MALTPCRKPLKLSKIKFKTFFCEKIHKRKKVNDQKISKGMRRRLWKTFSKNSTLLVALFAVLLAIAKAIQCRDVSRKTFKFVSGASLSLINF